MISVFSFSFRSPLCSQREEHCNYLFPATIFYTQPYRLVEIWNSSIPRVDPKFHHGQFPFERKAYTLTFTASVLHGQDRLDIS